MLLPADRLDNLDNGRAVLALEHGDHGRLFRALVRRWRVRASGRRPCVPVQHFWDKFYD